MSEIGILGAGSWGTALAILLSNNGQQVTLWSHRPEEAKRLDQTRLHESKLPGVRIPDEIKITAELDQAMRGKHVLVLAVPSSQMRTTCKRISPWVLSLIHIFYELKLWPGTGQRECGGES